jgi:hypothetical protein
MSCKSVQLKRKNPPRNLTNEEDHEYLLIQYENEKTFSVVKSSQFLVTDGNDGYIVYQGETYDAKILRRGSKDKIEKKAKSYSKNESLVTTDTEIQNTIYKSKKFLKLFQLN